MITHTVMREDRGYINPREYGTALNHTTLQAALTAIGSTQTGLLLTPGTWSIGANLTIPANVTLVRSRGAMLSISSGVIVTLNGDQEGPLNQWITGAGALLVGSRVPEVYPDWWGAVGDGTTNDEAAVQKAINALPAAGGTVCCVGQYGLNTVGVAITSKSKLTMKGTGPRSGFKLLGIPTQAAGPWSAVSLAILTSTQIHVQDLWFDGNHVAANPLALSGCTECVVERVTVIGAGKQAGILSAASTRNAYRNNIVRDGFVGTICLGIYLGNTNPGQLEHEPIVSGNQVSNMPATGIAVIAVGATISHNIVLNCYSGIIQPANLAEVASRQTITGNYVRGCIGHGIQSDATDDSMWSEFITCTGNVCEENYGSGIYAVRARDWVISGNICRNNNVDGVSNAHGIQLDMAKRVLLVGNLCEDTRTGAARTQQHGIHVATGTAPLAIEDVQITGNLCRNNLQSGISVQVSGAGTMDTVSVVGNLCVDNGDRGIMIPDSVPGSLLNVTVVGNTAFGNGISDLRLNPREVLMANNAHLTEEVTIPNLANNDPTPSVKGRSLYKVANTAATSITMFDDGVEGQDLTLIFYTNTNTTLVQGNLALAGGVSRANVPMNAVMRFIYQGGFWWEISRSQS